MKTTPIKAIRLKCLECSAASAAEVRRCPIEDCPLWPYRLGHRPTDADRAAHLVALSCAGGLG